MSATVTSIDPKKMPFNSQAEVATVASIDEQGRIIQVNLITETKGNDFVNQTVTNQVVTSQAKHISRAVINDSVLVQNTAQGLIVIAQLASPTDSPSAHITDTNGHVNVKGAKSVTLSTNKGTIEVHDDGTIVLDATELSATSERDFSIAGWPIRLN